VTLQSKLNHYLSVHKYDMFVHSIGVSTMRYSLLSDLWTKQQTWSVKVKIMRLWGSINNRTNELMSLDMILMDEKIFFLDYITLHIIYIYESIF
jgi:hypothetical protein